METALQASADRSKPGVVSLTCFILRFLYRADPLPPAYMPSVNFSNLSSQQPKHTTLLGTTSPLPPWSQQEACSFAACMLLFGSLFSPSFPFPSPPLPPSLEMAGKPWKHWGKRCFSPLPAAFKGSESAESIWFAEPAKRGFSYLLNPPNGDFWFGWLGSRIKPNCQDLAVVFCFVF